MKAKTKIFKTLTIYRIFKRNHLGVETSNQYARQKEEAFQLFESEVDWYNSKIESRNNQVRKTQKRWASFYLFGELVSQKECIDIFGEALYEKVVRFCYFNQYNVKITEFEILMEKVWVW